MRNIWVVFDNMNLVSVGAYWNEHEARDAAKYHALFHDVNEADVIVESYVVHE